VELARLLRLAGFERRALGLERPAVCLRISLSARILSARSALLAGVSLSVRVIRVRVAVVTVVLVLMIVAVCHLLATTVILPFTTE
jgi:hypothetical protein